MKSILLSGEDYQPSKIICVGRNYVEHIKELNNQDPGEIVLFLKPNSAISEEDILLPEGRCRYEGEISFLIKNGMIYGVGFGLDLTLPEVQNRLKKKGLPWEKAKAFDNSAVFSKFVVIDNYENLKLEFWVNDELRQKGGIKLMINKPAEILAEIGKHFTIEDYDIIMSGTPSGVGELNRGDSVTGKVFSGDELLVEQNWAVK